MTTDTDRAAVLADHPVTNAEYAAFVAAGGDPDWPGPCGGADDVAAVRVNYPHAVAYCEWRSEQDGTACRLPTDGEWQAWVEGLPDGDPRRSVRPGDVWEWTATLWDGEADTPTARRVVRGGSWRVDYLPARAAYRFWCYPGDRRGSYVGFRVVLPDVDDAPGDRDGRAAGEFGRVVLGLLAERDVSISRNFDTPDGRRLWTATAGEYRAAGLGTPLEAVRHLAAMVAERRR